MRKTGVFLLSAIGAVAFMAVGCADKKDVEEIKSRQNEILAKLAELKTDVGKVAAAPRQAARPVVNAAAVQNIPIGDSHVRGPKRAPVTIAEFGDFQ